MDQAAIENHKIAAQKLDAIKDAAFSFIRKNLGRILEYQVNEFVLSEFKKEGLVSDYETLIAACGENTSFVHYYPPKIESKIIDKDCLVLLDIWGRLNKEDSPFADITWMGYTGKDIPKEMAAAFGRVAGARDFALKLIAGYLKKKKLPRTDQVHSAVRKYFGKSDEYFLHGTGHSLGLSEVHGTYFRFGRKSNAKMKREIPFTIEPGLYFAGKFGIRSEMNCYVSENYKLVATTEIQKEIVKI